jgi:hypothetical protein
MLPLQAGFGDLVAEDEIRLPQHDPASPRDLADHADGEAGAGEGLAHDEIFRQLQLAAQLTDLVLEEHPQRLDDLLEIHIVRQAAHVVVALDGGGVAEAGFDHVGVDGALGQIVDLADLLGLLLEDADELLADDLALALRLGDAGELVERKRSSALTRMKLMSHLLKAFSTSSPSSLRMRPWSTNTQVSWLPMASAMSAAATEESTPPDKASSTLPEPTFERIEAIAVSR